MNIKRPTDDRSDHSSYAGEEEDEYGQEEIFLDEQTMVSIIKFQALVRGYLTRKLIYEHL